MTQIAIGSFTPVTQCHFAGNTATLRIYASQDFIDSLGALIFGSAAGSNGYYLEVDCTIDPTSRRMTIPSFTLPSTTDAQELGATWTGQIFDQSGGLRNTLFSQWSLSPSLGTFITFAEWAIYNNPTTLYFPPFQTLTTDQIQALIYAAINALRTAPFVGSGTLTVGVATVNTARVQSGSVITVSAQDADSTGALSIRNIVPGVSFDVWSSNPADSGLVGWAMWDVVPATQGIATMRAGVAVVNCSIVVSNSIILLTGQGFDVTGTAFVQSRSAGVSFTIASSNPADSGTVAWVILEP